jgi:hypothetical protein
MYQPQEYAADEEKGQRGKPPNATGVCGGCMPASTGPNDDVASYIGIFLCLLMFLLLILCLSYAFSPYYYGHNNHNGYNNNNGYYDNGRLSCYGCW